MQQALPSPAMAGRRAKPRPGEGGVSAERSPRAEGNGTAANGTFHLVRPQRGRGEQLPFSLRLSVAAECSGPRRIPLLRPRCGSSQPSLEEQGRGTGTAEGVREGRPPGAGLRGHREDSLGSGGLRGAPGAGETPRWGFAGGSPWRGVKGSQGVVARARTHTPGSGGCQERREAEGLRA